jgi:outer membrane protein assembly factor BamB
VWSLDSKGSPDFGAASSPALVDGTLIAAIGPQTGGALSAFDAATGKLKWQWKDDGPAYASPIVCYVWRRPPGDHEYAQEHRGRVVAEGKLLWKVSLETPYDQNSVTPIVVGDLVIYSGLSNPVTAIQPGASGRKAWENKEVGMYMNSPVLAAGVLWACRIATRGSFSDWIPRQARQFGRAKAGRPRMQQ